MLHPVRSRPSPNSSSSSPVLDGLGRFAAGGRRAVAEEAGGTLRLGLYGFVCSSKFQGRVKQQLFTAWKLSHTQIKA
ncbi:hypothetical protein Droror1_Dr00008904 [Drosera rotundifolia]